MRKVACLCAALVLIGCGGGPEVVRVVDGRLVGGAYVEPEAYASFLRGAIAEEQGDLRTALAAYNDAARRDSEDPEVWTRIGDVICRISPADGNADKALARALALDPAYAPAWAARARCRTARDPKAFAEEEAQRAAAADPLAVEPQVLLAQAEERRAHAAAARDRLLALTLYQAGSAAAWDALAAWAGTHGDQALVTRALEEAVRRSPGRRAEIAARAEKLAGDGELASARKVAGAALDVEGPRVSPLAARLAIDDALAAGDVEKARVRAARGHVGLDEVAGRALLMGNADLAHALAAPLAAADPGSIGARLVLAAALRDGAELASAFRGARPSANFVPFAAVAPFVVRLAEVAGPDAAQRFARALRTERPALGDAAIARAAADLAACGALDDSVLPLDARIELAARRREPPPDPSPGAVDARHELLALALLRPTGDATLSLARRLAPAAARDPLVAAALAKISLARGAPIDAVRLATLDPSDAIAAAAALDVARTRGDARAIDPARARLTALARTAAERALVRE